MLATRLFGPCQVVVEEVDDPRIELPQDVIVRVTHACICGSDLWAYRGVARRAPRQPMGHEFAGQVEAVGSAVRALSPGDPVISPFSWSCGQCWACRNGLQPSCADAGFWGRSPGAPGAQAEQVRVPFGEATLLRVPAHRLAANPAAMLALGDVLSTGHHAARSAGVHHGATTVVIGDGAVGLCAVMAARRLGAAHVLLVARHEQRANLGLRLGASDAILQGDIDVVSEIRTRMDGRGADCVLECVGTEESHRLAVGAARDGGAIGIVGVPHGVERFPIREAFGRNLTIGGGIAPARAYMPELLEEVLAGGLEPSPIFDVSLPLEHVAEGYEAMSQRRAIKVLLEVSPLQA